MRVHLNHRILTRYFTVTRDELVYNDATKYDLKGQIYVILRLKKRI